MRNVLLAAGLYNVLWGAFVVLFPAGLNLTLKQLYPPPSRAAFQDDLRDGTDDATRRGSQLLAQYLEDHPELAPAGPAANENDFFRTRFAVNAEVERLAAPLRAAFAAQLARQQTVIERLRWFSPVLVLHHSALTLAGTGTHTATLRVGTRSESIDVVGNVAQVRGLARIGEDWSLEF